MSTRHKKLSLRPVVALNDNTRVVRKPIRKVLNNKQYKEYINSLIKHDSDGKYFSARDLYKAEKLGNPISDDKGHLYIPTTYNNKKTSVTLAGNYTPKLKAARRKEALDILLKDKELKDIQLGFEIINNPDNPIGWIPGIRTLYNIGADLRSKRLTGSSPYTTDAAISTGIDLTTLGALKSYAGAYAGSVLGGIVGDKYDAPNLGRFVGGLVGGFSPNFIKRPQLKKSLTYEDTQNYTPELWDAAYNQAIKAGDMDQVQKLRDWHYLSSVPHSEFTATSSNTPVTYYHGTNYGGHTIFNSDISDATIGGLSTIGIKGNFLTTSKDAAGIYAGGNTTINPRFMHTYDNRYVTLLMDIKNPFKELFRKLYEELEKNLINLKIKPKKRQKLLEEFLNKNGISYEDIYNTSMIQNRVIYPLYVNPGNKTKIVDFNGNNWSEAPLISSTFLVKERVPTWFPVGSKTYNLSSLSDEVRTSAIFNNEDDAITFMQNRLGRRTKPTKMNDGALHTTDIAYTYPENALRNRSTIGVFKRKYPQTTNGVVQNAWDNGYTSVVINNVKDGVDYPIQDFVTFNSNQMKLANPITYDNKGNVIPLSKRDNWAMPDIRYALPIFLLNNEN